MQNMDSSAEHTERGMNDAFADLEAFMAKAQSMVRLAQQLNDQLAATTARRAASPANPYGDAELLEPEEATFVRSSLAQLGLGMKNAPVTLDMSRDERRWVEQLARELAGVLQGEGEGAGRRGEAREGMMHSRGIIGLDEVWGGWNRARGVCESPSFSMAEMTFLRVPYSSHLPGNGAQDPALSPLPHAASNIHPHARLRPARAAHPGLLRALIRKPFRLAYKRERAVHEHRARRCRGAQRRPCGGADQGSRRSG